MSAGTTIKPRIGVLAAVVGLLVAALLATLGLAAARPGVAAAQARPCPNASAPATELSKRALRRATTCVINRIRDNRGRTKVVRDARLQRVAQRHSRAMVRTNCLKHRCPGQPPLQRRIRRSGYLDGARRWQFAQSTGCAPTARAMIRAWRTSKVNRTNLLRPRHREIGVGVLGRAPGPRTGCREGMATFTALLASRVP